MSFDKIEKAIIEYVEDNPYSDRKDIINTLSEKEDREKVEGKLDKLEKEMVLLELTDPSSSSLESRVPKKIYIVNPEK